MGEEIAIIGMAGRFPGANNLREFHRNLQTGRDCVVEISPQRFCDTNFPMGDDPYQVMGLLDQIDRFDRKFFNISPREAAQVDPHQRITLELAYEALEDSGYSPASFAGTNTSILVANADYTYLRNLGTLEPTMYSGNSQFSIAGRLSRLFNTKGAAFIVDTGCSSGLLAVSLACDQILLGRCDAALVVGVRVVLDPLPVNLDVDVGITSNDGRTRSFNADSNGSGSSEAAVAVLLKPLRQALADEDHIHAVIKATSVNSSAQSSASLTATSSTAQAEMIVAAWNRAGIDPTTVRFIEAHGSGTQLGDPIEIGGLDTAFRKFTDRKSFCAVSSVKSNIGHTDKVAGLSGLAKAVLSLRQGEHYAALHFNRPNPLIDFENSATFINTEFRPWVREGGTPRRAGVNSFGFSGNNVHVLLEEPPARAARAEDMLPRLVTFSSKRAGGAAENRAALLGHLEKSSGLALADIAFTLNTGREHFPHRDALLARDTADLIAQLRAAAAPTTESGARASRVEVLFAFSGDATIDPELTARLVAAHPEFKLRHAQCLAHAPESGGGEAVQRFAFQYALYYLLASSGVTASNIFGTGAGDLVVAVIAGEMELADAVRECSGNLPAGERDLEARLAGLVEKCAGSGRVVFAELGADGEIARGLRRLQGRTGDDQFEVTTLDVQAADSVLDLLRKLYLAGTTIDWSAAHRHYPGRRISLPGYQFEKIRCWYRESYSKEEYEAWRRRVASGHAVSLPLAETAAPKAQTPGTPVDESAWTPTERQVGRIWKDVLRLERLGLDDDFFALGGHSLFGTMVRNRVEKTFGLRLEFRDIFVHSRIRALAGSIDRLLAQGSRGEEEPIPALARAEHYASSPAQRLIWALESSEGSMNSAYNVPVILRLSGTLEVERLEWALRQIVARHEPLRTHFVEVDGEPRQVVSDASGFRLQRLAAMTPGEVDHLVERFIQPFDLARPPLLRSALIRCAGDQHVLALDIHHTLFDGTSLGVLLHELSVLYRGGQLPALHRTYKEYAAWRLASLATPPMREAEDFWLGQFRSEAPALRLPTDFPRPMQRSYEGGVLQFTFGAGLSNRVRAFAQQESTTLFMVLLAAYSALLSRLSAQEDVVVGSSVAGRTHTDVEPLIGMFVNTVAFRNAPAAGLSFHEFLTQVRDNCLQVYKHQDYPLDTLLRKLDLPRDPTRHPLFDTFLVLQNMSLGSNQLADGLQMSAVDYARRSAKYDLTFEFYDDAEGIALNVEYCTALFLPKTIEAIVAALQEALARVCENPATRLGELSGLPTADETAELDDSSDLPLQQSSK